LKAPGRANLYRDRFGTPYAIGESDQAALFALGYAQAEDHALELPFLVLQVEGRLAEIFGPDCLKSDRRLRQLGFAHDAEAVAASLSADLREGVLKPFADGFNAGLAAQSALPDWVGRAGPLDPRRMTALALFHGFVLALANDPHGYGGFVAEAPWRTDGGVARSPSMGSNAFALGGRRSRSGAPILGAIPHLSLRHPFLLFEAGIKGSEIDAHGFTFLGLPLPIFGFTPGIAWGITIDYVDAYDRVYEAWRDGPGPSVLRHDGWQVVEQRQEVIKVMGGPDVHLTVRTGDRGPFVLELAPGRAIALDWAGRRQGRLLEQLHAMAKARDLGQFEAALAILGTPNYAFTAADRHGRLLYAHLGQAPDRAATFMSPGGPAPCATLAVDAVLDQAKPVAPCLADTLPGIPGWAKDGARVGIVGYDALPVERDPLAGWIQSANTPAHTHSKSSRLAECLGESIAPCRDMPNYRQNDRGRRLTSIGEAMTAATLDDLKASLFDGYASSADRLLPLLFEAWRRTAASLAPGERRRLEPALAALQRWNRTSERLSSTSALYHAYARALGIDDKADDAARLGALGLAVEYLERHFGRIDPPWHEINRLRREPSALRQGTKVDIGVAGGLQALGHLHAFDGATPPFLGSLIGRDIRINPAHRGREEAIFGSAAGMVVEMLPTGPQARTALVFGSSDDPTSPHFADQARELFGQDRFKTVPFARDDIVKAATSRHDFSP